MGKPSELFEECFASNTSGCVRVCIWEKTHYDTCNHWDWEKGEFENLQELSEKEPDSFIPWDHSIGTMTIGSVEIVDGCDCGIALRYEDFIISHSAQIAKYLNKRSKKLKKEAKESEIILE